MRAAGRGEAQRMMGRDRQLTIAAVEAGPTLEEPELLSLPDNADGDQRVQRQKHWSPVELRSVVKIAIELEMQYMAGLKVLEDSDRRCDACAETGRLLTPTDWVQSINKGGPNYRSRLLCRETCVR